MTDTLKTPDHGRKYSLAEIDAMRGALQAIEMYEATPPGASHFTWRGPQPKRTEDQLRTYMAGGIEPQELLDKAQKVADWLQRRREEARGER